MVHQTFRDFELLIVDDGSTDETPEVLRKWAARDRRIRLESIPRGGVSVALNHGLERVRGQLVARLDADDVAHPQRLARQVEFLDRNRSVGIVGSAVEKNDETGRVFASAARPQRDLEIRFKALLWCPFTHSAVTLRRTLLLDHGLRYDETLNGSEDYDFFVRLLETTRGANLAERLVQYRVREGRSRSNYPAFSETAVEIGSRVIERWAPDFVAGADEVRALRQAFGGMGRANPPPGHSGVHLTRRYGELHRAFGQGRPSAREAGALARSESDRFLRSLHPIAHPAAARTVLAVARLNHAFPRRWLRHWGRRTVRTSLARLRRRRRATRA